MLENVYSYRLKFKYIDNDLIDVILRCNNKSIGYIKEISKEDDLFIEFDIKSEYRGLGYQTEALREYQR
ncbi:MAG: hypothetical protein K6E20_00790, partial [Acholeplasmatales bacterium]|nr:hypothetical protein [Acholeplasmatales bacterium]